MSDTSAAGRRARAASFDNSLGQHIIDLNIWAVRQGLLGIDVPVFFGDFCRNLAAAGVPLWRAFAGMRTLHPQWGGYGYTWQSDFRDVAPAQFERGIDYEATLAQSPFGPLIERVIAAGPMDDPQQHLRRRLTGPQALLDFPQLERLATEGATDYFASLTAFGGGDPSRGSGVGFAFSTRQPDGFSDDDLLLVQAALPAVSLAIMAQVGHTIAGGLLAAYLGHDAGGRVHAGSVVRGSSESLRAVLWYADIRGFTAIAEKTPGPAVIEMLDETFEALTAPLRPHGGQVLKFLGDGMLAIFPCLEATQSVTCDHALDAAAEAMQAIDRLNRARRTAGKPAAGVDLALHLGEVLYGNIGAIDRLDFTVIGPAVNEASRIEGLCEPLGARVLASAELAGMVGGRRLRSLGRHRLRGVREEREIYALDLGD